MLVTALSTARQIYPNGIWDVHHHVFEPDRFTYSEDRHLTPPPATIKQFLDFKRTTGITHSVLTHGLSYGSDCSSLTTFLEELGTVCTKGISVIDPETTSIAELSRMHDAGVRGIRVNLYRYGAMHDLEKQKATLRAHARCIANFRGWTMAFTHVHPEFWAELCPVIESEVAIRGIRLVTDHFALLKGASMLREDQASSPLTQPGFEAIISLVRDGLLWVKISAPYRVSNLSPTFDDLKPLVRALVDANPRRILYGSDWPHTPLMRVRSREEALQETPYLQVDDVKWLHTLRSWLSDQEWDNIVWRNPNELYNW